MRRRVATMLLLALLAACGSRGAESPEVDIGDADGTRPPPVPKEPKREPSKRPPMNDAAKEAYQAGQTAFGAGDVAGAEAQFRAAVARDPRAFQAHYALGTALERLGRPDDARDAYEEALGIVPDFEPSIHALANLFVGQGNTSQAEAFLNRLLGKVPDSAAALAALAEVKSVQRDSPAAQRLAQQALKEDPDYRPAMVVLARDHYRARRLDLALYTLTAILDGYGAENPPRDRDNAEARLIRALIFREQGKRKAAIEELTRVVRLRPDLVEARLHLGATLLESGNAAAAVPVLEGALAYDPGNVLVHLNLGDGYRLQGRPDEAIKQLTWVVQAAPSLAQAHYNLGLLYLFSKLGNKTELEAVELSIKEFETYLAMKPRTKPGAGDDAEELLARAKTKQSILRAMDGNAAQGTGAATGAAGAAPGGAAAP